MAAKKNDLWAGLAVMAVSLGALGWILWSRSRPIEVDVPTSMMNADPHAGLDKHAPPLTPLSPAPTAPPKADQVRTVGTFNDTMNEIDEAFARLQTAADHGWTAAPPVLPAPTVLPAPADDAGAIAELLRSLWHAEYSADPAKAGDIGRRMLAAADSAEALERALDSGSADDRADAFAALADSCADCHERYRD